jgi:nucleoid-associated protein YejK
MHSVQLLPDRESLSFTEALELQDTHYEVINFTIILQISDVNVLSESSEYFILLKTKEGLVIISNVVRTSVFTTNR